MIKVNFYNKKLLREDFKNMIKKLRIRKLKFIFIHN
jgi:hypothetical protein